MAASGCSRKRRGVAFRSITEQIDTATPGGKLIFHVFVALELGERDLTRERIHAGSTAVRARGRAGGRPRKLTIEQIALANRMHADKQTDIVTICQSTGTSKATL